MPKIKTKHSWSIVKAITWRAIATVTTTSIVFIATGNISLSLGVGFFDVVIKLALYYWRRRASETKNQQLFVSEPTRPNVPRQNESVGLTFGTGGGAKKGTIPFISMNKPGVRLIGVVY